jgi:hypothetical protein
LANWFLQFFNSILNLAILAWVDQFPRYFFGMRLRDIAAGLVVAVAVILLVILVERLLGHGDDSGSEPAGRVYMEALVIGISSMALGIVPIIMANRHIDLGVFSHYALPASLAAAVALAGFIHFLPSRFVQMVSLCTLVGFAALAHTSISVHALNEENAIEKFWWQVNWRVPALRPGTTLVIHYPSGNIGDDGNGVMEAANMIYFPQPSDQIPVRYNVSALTLGNANLQEILAGNLYKETIYRSHAVDTDYGNILVLSQPTPASCVHVIDGQRPLISVSDPGNVLLVSPSSDVENVIVDSEPFIPQDFAFGPEPEHKWCYYFEKAELALQLGHWEQAALLGEEAIRLHQHPEDQSEWIPFLEAYALTGNEQRVKQTAPKINADRFLRLQACDRLTAIETVVTPEVRELISTLYCRNAE